MLLDQKATPRALKMRRKIQQTIFVWHCELQTPKPGRGSEL